ncbi:MAG: hypothetical protein UY05_C0001G0012 [Candidatus Peregrinibacteria bacterium GW2011_GWA2_47_7]|nr:MAG: hypothetical protein UY05_C0001G0012 [Candidatus Peregrinibacteria bacterium GW2011_GWA2_47_7]
MSDTLSFLKKFFQDDLNELLVNLLMRAPLRSEERFGWMKLIPLMNPEEKTALKANLEKEIAHFEAREERVANAMANTDTEVVEHQ